MLKFVFLLASMASWLLVGAALIYLSPVIAHNLTQSELTATWMGTLQRGGYYPNLAIGVGGLMAVIGTVLSIVGNFNLKQEPQD
ncbi:MAG: hypothetical protein B0A82_00545 [Alkalinema sp. CACIAM 70d]|nr:MAG: hypothetical protein B0A82_00545 [Alkalinema sp. CACIAM 70d]